MKIKKIVDMENALKENKNDFSLLLEAKKMGFGDKFIAKLWNIGNTYLLERRGSLRKKSIDIYPQNLRQIGQKGYVGA